MYSQGRRVTKLKTEKLNEILHTNMVRTMALEPRQPDLQLQKEDGRIPSVESSLAHGKRTTESYM